MRPPVHRTTPTRHRPIARAVAAAAALALPVTACSSDEPASTTTAPELTLVPVTDPPATTAAPGEPVDQTAPTSTNGMAFVDDVLWIAALADDVVLAVDPDTGEILQRVALSPGTGPDDLALGPDGRLWWTGFTSGAIGTIDPATGEAVAVTDLATGANPIAFGPDGRLFVGLAVTADALYEIDPADGTARLVTDAPGNVNGFAVAPDGRIWGPRFGLGGQGAIVAIDPDGGDVEVLAEGLSGDVALAIGPDGRAYVVTVAPATVQVWDPEGDTLATFAELATPAGDNLAFRDDGALYVSGFDQPLLTVVAPDGTVTTVAVGEG